MNKSKESDSSLLHSPFSFVINSMLFESIIFSINNADIDAVESKFTVRFTNSSEKLSDFIFVASPLLTSIRQSNSSFLEVAFLYPSFSDSIIYFPFNPLLNFTEYL